MEWIVYVGGIFFWVWVVSKTMAALWFWILRPPTSFEKYKGRWAVVVGASEGLGRTFALCLAKRGMNVVIVARTEQKLKLVMKEIQSLGRDCKMIVVDVTHDLYTEKLNNQLKDIEVAFLVNNAGGVIGEPVLRDFLQYSKEEIEKMRKLNTGYVYDTIRLLLPQMIQKRDGAILNIGTLASLYSMFLIPYSSEKSKLNQFTESLNLEYSHFGITIQCQLAGKIATEQLLTKVGQGQNWDAPSPMKMAECSLNSFGAGGSVTIPYWAHAIEIALLSSLPNFLGRRILYSIYSSLKNKNKID